MMNLKDEISTVILKFHNEVLSSKEMSNAEKSQYILEEETAISSSMYLSALKACIKEEFQQEHLDQTIEMIKYIFEGKQHPGRTCQH